MCAKESWGNLHTVDTALSVAVQRFNKGSTALLDMMLERTLVAGSSLELYMEKENTSRVVSGSSLEPVCGEREHFQGCDRITPGAVCAERGHFQCCGSHQQTLSQGEREVKRQGRRKRQEREGSVYGTGQV